MAAVLCKGIGQCCTAPCKLCADCCGPCCKSTCSVCSDVCGSNFCKNPFCSFVTLALVVQIPVIGLGLMGISGIPDCNQSIWLLVNAVFGVINIGTSFYLAYQIVNPKNEAMAELTTVYERTRYLLCNDCYIAIYICLFIGYIALLAMGSFWGVSSYFTTDDDVQQEVNPCDGLQIIVVQGATSCGWFFVCAAPAALIFSLCCAKIDGRFIDTTPPPPPNNNNNNPHADVEAPAYAQAQAQQAPPPPPAGKVPYTKQQQQQQQEPNWDSNPEPEIVYAQEIPPPPTQQASAPPSSYDNTYMPSGEQAGNASNASNNNNNNNTVDKKEETGGNIGGAVGKNVAKLFGASDAKQEKLERQGKQAGAAVGKGVSKATNFVKSKLK